MTPNVFVRKEQNKLICVIKLDYVVDSEVKIVVLIVIDKVDLVITYLDYYLHQIKKKVVIDFIDV